MTKYSMRFDRYAQIQDKKIRKVGIEQEAVWETVGKARRCAVRYDSGEDYFANMSDKVLNTATIRMVYDPNVRETMRVVVLGAEYAIFKIISVMHNKVNGRLITQLKVQRWVEN